jgi:uncharacterized membrane protein
MLDFTVLNGLDPAIVVHLVAAMLAMILGPLAIYRKRRDRLHRVLGYAWVAAIALTAVSSFALHAVVLHFAFGFGAIHLLAVWALWTIWAGVQDARAGRIAPHRARMAGLYWQGLTVAGLLTLLPGRVLNDFLFATRPEIGLWVILGFGAGLLWINLRSGLTAPSVPERHRREVR